VVQSLRTTRINSGVFSKTSRLSAAKFDPVDYITVSVTKPLGLSLEEVAENEKRGVVVEGLDDGGSAKANGKIRPGLFLVSVNGFDTKFEDFDTILDKIKSAPEGKPLELTFIEPKNVWKGPATMTVSTPDGKTVTIQTLKGTNMRQVLQGTNIAIYSSKNTYTNCGGAGNCGTCGVLVTDNVDWEPRQKFEELRLKKYPSTARLSCMTDVEGDCSVVVLPAPSS
jgi:ferredoxin